MSRLYCEHLVPISEHCVKCDQESDYLNAWEDGFAAARAWAGLAMWCMCGDGGKYAAALNQNLTDRAWQALRDFLNGTPEQWQARCEQRRDAGYHNGRADGFAHGATKEKFR